MRIFILLFTVISVGCATKKTESSPSEPIIPGPVERYDETAKDEALKIDFDRLQTHLKMDRSFDNLGYTEKPFSTCEVGYGYPSNRNCRMDYFVLIHFQLMCRETTEDTHYTALGSADMQALKGRTVKWNLEKSFGTLNLDDQGFGQIRLTAPISVRGKRLKINVGNENLYMKASDIRRVVTPSEWCH